MSKTSRKAAFARKPLPKTSLSRKTKPWANGSTLSVWSVMADFARA